jgi:hypothetical protein
MSVPPIKSPWSRAVAPNTSAWWNFPLRAFPAAVPTGAQLMKRAGVLTDGTPDELEGLAGRLAVFRIDPVA